MSPSSSFEIIQILVIYAKMLFLCDLYKKLVKAFQVYGGGAYATYIICNIIISNGFKLVTFRSPSRMEILMEGAENVVSN